MMHIASRILTKQAMQENDDVIRERIRNCLVSASGVTEVKSLEPHPKGGFVFTAEISEEQAEGFIDLVNQAGFMLGT